MGLFVMRGSEAQDQNNQAQYLETPWSVHPTEHALEGSALKPYATLKSVVWPCLRQTSARCSLVTSFWLLILGTRPPTLVG